jgi:hypothetical protein
MVVVQSLRRCILNKPVAKGLRKFPVYYCGSWDCGMIVIFGCLSLLAGISWSCCVERCPFLHQVILDWWEVKFVWYLYNMVMGRGPFFIEDKVLLKRCILITTNWFSLWKAMDGKTSITFNHMCEEARVKGSFCWATRFVGLGLCWTVSLCLVGKSKVQFSVL